MKHTVFFPQDGSYFAPGTFAQYLLATAPRMCRKYHISTALFCAAEVAQTALPILRSQQVAHKVVSNTDHLRRLMNGKQAGKFITIYLPAGVEHRNPLILSLADALGALAQDTGAQPSPTMPRLRGSNHLFLEQPLDAAMFIYGGFVVDSTV